MSRTDLTEKQWRKLEPHLPSNPHHGHVYVEHRHVINASYGACEQALLGVIFRRATVLGRPAMTDLFVGREMALGSDFSG